MLENVRVTNAENISDGFMCEDLMEFGLTVRGAESMMMSASRMSTVALRKEARSEREAKA